MLDISFTLKMFRERHLEQALESRKLEGYFGRVISVHPLSGLFERGNNRFGEPVVTQLDDEHVFVEGKIGVSPLLRFLPPLNLFFSQISLIRLLLKIARNDGDAKVDVIRVGDPYYLGLMGWLFSRLLKAPLAIRVCFDYDLLFKTTKKPVFPRLFGFRFIEKLVERFVFPRCALIAGANQNNLDYGIANGAAPEKGVVFRYGNLIDPLHFTDPLTRTEGEKLLYDIGVEGDFLATVSRLEEMKQPEQNLLALKLLKESGYDIKFVFIGDGSMREQLKEMASEFGLSEYVFFAGNRSQKWIAEVLPQARLVLSPHMGRGLTEACLAGAPIVAYDYDWQGEVIRSGVTGELVPDGEYNEMAQRAARLLDSPVRSRQLGLEARRVVMEMMDPETLTNHEIETYEALFNKTNNPVSCSY